MIEYVDICFDKSIKGMSDKDLILELIALFGYVKELSIKVEQIFSNNGIVEFRLEGNDEIINRLMDEL